MTYLRLVHAPALLTHAQTALVLTQETLGALLGVSRRTMTRWQGGGHHPSIQQWAVLARHVYAVKPALAAEIAAEMGETLVRAKIAKGNVVVAGAFDPSRTRHAHAVAVEQNPHHHHRVIRRFPPSVAPPAPPEPGPVVPEGPTRPVTPTAALVDSIVCAAAEAVATTPQSMRPALLAAFDRAAVVSLSIDEIRASLRPS